MKVKLTTWERVQLAVMVGRARGNVAQVRQGMHALDILELSNEEKEEIGWSEPAEGIVQWQDREQIWELQIDDELWKFVVAQAKARRDWPINQLTLQLLDKLGI